MFIVKKIMAKIIKENGNIWEVSEHLCYGVKHISKILIGTYDENEEVKKPIKEKKANKKEVEN